MKNKSRFTPAQKKFLRAYRQNPAGPPPADWPSPLVFRRWLRKPHFRKAVESIRDALRFQADLHLASASATAARAFVSPDAPLDPKRHLDLLHLSHTRQRFANVTPPEQAQDDDDTDQITLKKLTPEEIEDRDRHYPFLVHYYNETQDPKHLLEWIWFYATHDSRFLPFLVQFPDKYANAKETVEKSDAAKSGEKIG